MPAETGYIKKVSDVPPLTRVEKYCIEQTLAKRVRLLLRSEEIESKALFDAAKLPISSDEIVLVNKMRPAPSFFARDPKDLVQEIRGVLQGRFDICTQLGVISARGLPVRTADEFEFIKTTFVNHANEKFNELFPEQNHNDKMNLI